MSFFKPSYGGGDPKNATGGGWAPLPPAVDDGKKDNELPSPAFNPRSIYDIQKKWQKRGADIRLVVCHEPGKPSRLDIDFIGIPKSSRCKGYGAKLMKELLKAADFKKMEISLTPERSERSERSKKFFERHGFREATAEDSPFAWMVRKVFRRERPKAVQAQAPKEAKKPEPASLFMENAKRFKKGDKGAFAGYGNAGKVEYGASGSKSSYGLHAGAQDQERRPAPPMDIPEGHFASWNEDKREYELMPKRKVYGGLVFNEEGEILLRMVAGYVGGYVWTFPAGMAEPDEPAEEAAKREVEKKTGVTAQIVSEIPGSFEDELTEANFYAMQALSAGQPLSKETTQTAWVKPCEASAYLSQSMNDKARVRDSKLLDAALGYADGIFQEKISDSFQRVVGDPSESVAGESTGGEGKGAADVYHALIYWGRKEHRARYSPKEQREALARLLATAESLGIDPELLPTGAWAKGDQ